MLGNVWEWVSDRTTIDTTQAVPARIRRAGQEAQASCGTRGRSWISDLGDVRVADRLEA